MDYTIAIKEIANIINVLVINRNIQGDSGNVEFENLLLKILLEGTTSDVGVASNSKSSLLEKKETVSKKKIEELVSNNLGIFIGIDNSKTSVLNPSLIETSLAPNNVINLSLDSAPKVLALCSILEALKPGDEVIIKTDAKLIRIDNEGISTEDIRVDSKGTKPEIALHNTKEALPTKGIVSPIVPNERSTEDIRVDSKGTKPEIALHNTKEALP
ncbi:MAG: hypothetical protein ACP5RW_09520, partial [bacterium]